MRAAELLMSIALAALALGVMYKAGERPSWSGEARFSNVGFGETGSPAGGFWPFWVAAIMFVCCVWTFVNGLLRKTKPSQMGGPFLDAHGIGVLLTVAVPVFLLVLLTDWISLYFAMALFLFYYVLVLGRHPLLLALALALVLPFWMYLFFDITMTRTLPKGGELCLPLIGCLPDPGIESALYTPMGNWFRGLGAAPVSLFFLAGAIVLVAAAWVSRRREGEA